MTEREYLTVSALQRLRAAGSLLGEARPFEVDGSLRTQWYAALNLIDEMVAVVEKAAREQMASPIDPHRALPAPAPED